MSKPSAHCAHDTHDTHTAHRLRPARILGALPHAAIVVTFALCGALPPEDAAAQSTSPAPATSAYPNRPVRIIVGVDPGGPSDLITRATAQQLATRLGQSFVVENRGGAGGAIGLRALVAAANDGYTLGWGSFSSLVLRPAINLASVPFDPEKELMPVSLMAEQAFVLAVSSSLNVTSARDLVKVLKASPGKYNFGSSGTGSLPQLLFEIMKKQNGIAMEHIPYKSDATAFQSLMANTIQLMLTAPNLYGAGSDRVRVLAIAAPQRAPAYPNVPTLEEEGLPGMSYTAWHALVAPTGVPAAIVERIDREVRIGLATPEGRAAIEKMGVTPAVMDHARFATRFANESAQWRRIIKDLNLKID